jgi:signal transduction histidine kinase
MSKNNKKSVGGNIESKALLVFALIFVGVIFSTWASLVQLRATISEKNDAIASNIESLVKIERIRDHAKSKIANGRAFFLLGSKVLFDEQKKDQQNLKDSLASFEKEQPHAEVPAIIKKLVSYDDQHQEIFDQAMGYREKQTESKIVAQFFQSKSVPIGAMQNEALNELIQIEEAQLKSARQEAAFAEAQIGRGLLLATGIVVLLVFGLMFLVFRMIRERSRQFAERNRLYEEAMKAVHSRDEVLVAISHDLKSPLTSIAQNADNISTNPESSSIAETIEAIKSSVTVSESLIKDILDQANAEMGSMTLRLDQIGINEILSDARLMLQPIAKQRDVRLQIDVANPPVLAFFDRERVIRVLANLVGNAIKFSPKHGKVAVRVRSDQQFVYVAVTDEGPGIPEKQLPQIFEDFWQSRKTADQGPGIGLAVVKTIVEAHGGSVRVESQSGRGSTFTFTLPRRRPAGAVLGRPAAAVKHTVRARAPGATDSASNSAT